MMEKGQGFSWVSECGSGVESGWTYYLNESTYLSSGRSGVSRVIEGGGGKVVVNGRDDDDDEDGLSLVSDASSGPPHFEEGRSWRSGEDEECKNALFWRGRAVTGRERREDSCFEDTASSAKKNSCLSRNEAPGWALLPKVRQIKPHCSLRGSTPLMIDLDDACQREINGRNDPRRRQKSLAVHSTK